MLLWSCTSDPRICYEAEKKQHIWNAKSCSKNKNIAETSILKFSVYLLLLYIRVLQPQRNDTQTYQGSIIQIMEQHKDIKTQFLRSHSNTPGWSNQQDTLHLLSRRSNMSPKPTHTSTGLTLSEDLERIEILMHLSWYDVRVLLLEAVSSEVLSPAWGVCEFSSFIWAYEYSMLCQGQKPGLKVLTWFTF